MPRITSQSGVAERDRSPLCGGALAALSASTLAPECHTRTAAIGTDEILGVLFGRASGGFRSKRCG
jgi:hypothetical protein